MWAGTVDVVDVALGKVVRSLTAGDEPCGLVASADGHRLFVTNVVSNSVSILDTASGQALAEIPGGRASRRGQGTQLVGLAGRCLGMAHEEQAHAPSVDGTRHRPAH